MVLTPGARLGPNEIPEPILQLSTSGFMYNVHVMKRYTRLRPGRACRRPWTTPRRARRS
jgi:hypothetical protein